MTKTWMAWCLALLAAAVITASPAHAGVGLAELPGQQGDGPVTVFYPAQEADQPVQRGPFALQLAWQGTPVPGNGRLVVVSHGSGGSPWVHTDLARALVQAGFVVALPEHAGDNYKDHSTPGPESWKRRPAEVSRAVDAVAQDARLAPLLALDKVGVFGGSAGGHTALVFAGGQWSPARFKQHCEAHLAEDFSSCVGFTTRLHGNWLDGIKKAVAITIIRHRFGDETLYAHTDPRVAATVAVVPFAADFDMGSLATPRIALGLITAGKDVNQIPRFHSSAVLAACQDRCTHLADLQDGSHGIMLSPMPPLDRMNDLTRELLGDPPGFDRSVLPQVDASTVAFFAKHLQPLKPATPSQRPDHAHAGALSRPLRRLECQAPCP